MLDFLSGPIGIALAVAAVAAVVWIVAGRDPRQRRQRLRSVADVAGTLLVAAAVAYAVQLWIVKPYRVPSASMERTLHTGDRVLAARFLYHFTDPKRGEIIVFHPNGVGSDAEVSQHVASVTFVKRLIGLPGEWIEIRGGHVHVCGAPPPRDCRVLNEPYVSSPQASFGPVHIPANHYFMLGDNRANSYDSRAWGPIRRSQIIGRVFMTYWPPTRIAFY